MGKLTKDRIADIRRQIEAVGLTIQAAYGRTGTVTARLWHNDGTILARAGGYGYDKTGTAIGEAVSILLAPECMALFERGAPYGMPVAGRIDGACGIESVTRIVRLLEVGGELGGPLEVEDRTGDVYRWRTRAQVARDLELAARDRERDLDTARRDAAKRSAA